MKKILKFLPHSACFLFLLLTNSGAFAQNEPNPSSGPIDNVLRSNGMIYVVVGVILIILSGIFIYLTTLDKKLTKLEKEIQENK